ncbi:hypothetical protein EW026_g3051 [Hermanssonia centrifuga]|uniref:RNA 3'-terminal phosphate cyclase n=1 Tax=Hermanssonia centrifuga TaxID=98765 RepID=A0A4S4KQZ0_9APHY|nr:hypothetical protein EW026_g3051 [Hermanssonia centrifuga]
MNVAALQLIDGSVLEGGGQLLRNSVAFSALFSRPIAIHNIRHNRKPPGLRYQHTAGIQLVADISSAHVTGCETGSNSVNFSPGLIRTGRQYTADPKTAGSTTLLLQVALPCLLYSASPAPSRLILRGGTNATHAPQIDYTQHIFLPFLRRHFGLNPTLEVVKRGYYPKGGGEIRLTLSPIKGPLSPVLLTERGMVKSVCGKAYVAGLPRHLAEQMCSAAKSKLVSSGIDSTVIDITAVREKNQDVVGSGSGVVLWAETENGCILGGSSIGLKGKDPETVGQEAADELIRNLNHGGCVDEYLQDQIIIFLALAKGTSSIRTGPLTLHTRTAIYIAEQLTCAKFKVVEEDDVSQTTLLSCDGVGYIAPDATTVIPG